MKKINYIQIAITIIFLMSISVVANVENDVSNTLYNYYQYEMDEKIDNYMSLVDSSHILAKDRSKYIEEIRNLVLSLFESYDTEYFEITDADIFIDSEEKNSKIFYHLKSKVNTADGNFFEIDNEFVALLYNFENEWKITYVMPRISYENGKIVRAQINSFINFNENKINDDKNLINNDKNKIKVNKNNLFNSLFNSISKIFSSIFSVKKQNASNLNIQNKNINDENSKNQNMNNNVLDSSKDLLNIKLGSCSDMEKQWIQLLSLLYDKSMQNNLTDIYDESINKLSVKLLEKCKSDSSTFMNCRGVLESYKLAKKGQAKFSSGFEISQNMAEKRFIIELKSCIDTKSNSSVSSQETVPYGCYNKYKEYIDAKNKGTNVFNSHLSTKEEIDFANENIKKKEIEYFECQFSVAQSNLCEQEYIQYVDASEIYFGKLKENLRSDMINPYLSKFQLSKREYEKCRYKNNLDNNIINDMGIICEDAYYKYMLTVRANQKAQSGDFSEEYKSDMKNNMQIGYEYYQNCLN